MTDHTSRPLDPEIDADISALLADAPDERDFHEFYLSEAQMRTLCRALRGDSPADEMAVEDRRRLLEGLLWQLTGEQEHPP
jgi:hypothetical protein